MEKPRISVIMPVYNAERYLEDSIKSILSQTYTNFELLIGDDGSTDRSFEIMKSFRDERLTIIMNEKNLGIPHTLNKLIESCKGEYIARQDSDDISLPKRLEKQVDFLDKNPEIGLCGTNITHFGNRSKRMFMPQMDKDIKVYFLVNNPICQPTIMIRKGCLTKPYDKSFDLAEDYAHCYELSKVTKLANLPDFLLKYRWHGTNISTTKEKKMLENANSIRIIIFRETLSYEIQEQELRLLKLATESKLADYSDLLLFEKFLIEINSKNYATGYYDEFAFHQLNFHLWTAACLKLKGVSLFKKIRMLLLSELFTFNSLIHDLSFKNIYTFFENQLM